MSLERLYYNDPFSNIVISCELHGIFDKINVVQAIETAIKGCKSFGMAISLDENGNLRYDYVGYEKNLKNIIYSDLDEIGMVHLLMASPFDLQQGETIKIIIRKEVCGICIYFCIHHIIADAGSLILLIKSVFANIENLQSNYILEDVSSKLYSQAVLDMQATFLINTINKNYPKKQYSKKDYLDMFNSLYENNVLEIERIIIEKEKLLELKNICKTLGVSITSYIASKIFDVQNIELLCLPVDLRENENSFGNHVGRIDITFKLISKELNKEKSLYSINNYIKSAMVDKKSSSRFETILNHIHPEFYDDVIFDIYSNISNSFSGKMADIIGYKGKRRTTYLSNLKTITFPAVKKFEIRNLSFYPPPALERISTIGVVTQNNQMIITIQKFKKEETL